MKPRDPSLSIVMPHQGCSRLGSPVGANKETGQVKGMCGDPLLNFICLKFHRMCDGYITFITHIMKPSESLQGMLMPYEVRS